MSEPTQPAAPPALPANIDPALFGSILKEAVDRAVSERLASTVEGVRGIAREIVNEAFARTAPPAPAAPPAASPAPAAPAAAPQALSAEPDQLPTESLGNWLIRRHQVQEQARATSNPLDGTLDPSKSFGLRAKRA